MLHLSNRSILLHWSAITQWITPLIISSDQRWIYHLVMTNSLPKSPFSSSVNNLFLWTIYTMAMLNNQRVVWNSNDVIKKDTRNFAVCCYCYAFCLRHILTQNVDPQISGEQRKNRIRTSRLIHTSSHGNVAFTALFEAVEIWLFSRIKPVISTLPESNMDMDSPPSADYFLWETVVV